PSVVDLAKYPRDRAPPDGPFTIAWIGSRTTAPYLGLAEPALARVLRAGERVRVVGPRAPALRVPVEERPWSEATEAADLASSHAGIMPLPDTPWERGKCGYKIVQYMAAGLPVVASPVGVNRDLVEPGRNGFLAAGTDEWVEALTRLRDEPKLAEWMGREGRAKVERDYSVEANAPRFARLLRELEVGS
ncbi:MAG: glycosyltransferase, partial [Methanobacteriota archaeon]